MKKYIIGLFVIALGVAGSAFIADAKQSAEQSEVFTPLYWYSPDGEVFHGENIKGSLTTPGSQVAITGCDGTIARPECQRGFTADKLVDEEDPELGIQDGMLNQYADRIFDALP